MLKIRSVTARPIIAPLARPVRTAVGTIPSAPLVLIDVQTEQGVVGRSYLFAYTPVAVGPLAQLVQKVGGELLGEAVAPFERFQALDRRFRLLGWQGLAGMAVSGLDMALWDALARSLDLPVCTLLGGSPRSLRAYESLGVFDPEADADHVSSVVEEGVRGVKIKLGDGDLQKDVQAVKAVRRLIGPEVALMIDFNQALNAPEAIRRIERLAEWELAWVEEPVRAEDHHGHARVRQACRCPVQTGENWWFSRDMANSIEAGASDFAMLDLMKIGGVTGWLRAASLAEASGLPVSSHIFVEASAHALSVTPTAHWIEHLDVAGSVLANPCRIVNGSVTPSGPGLGLEWDEKAVGRYALA
jgi:mandelate racemase